MIAPTGNVTEILPRGLSDRISIKRNSILSLSGMSIACLENTSGVKSSGICYRKTTGPIGSRVYIKDSFYRIPDPFL